jgi:nicotinamidase-related amidase
MKSALLVIDVQQALCSGEWRVFDIDQVVDRINELAAKARSVGAPVFFIQHEEDRGSLQFGSKGWQLYERLDAKPDDIRIRKSASDAFHGTELHALLQARGVGELVVCGVQSEFCVDSTVRRALSLRFAVVLVSNAHSTMDNGVLSAAQISAHHNATLADIGGYAYTAKATTAAEVHFGV